MSDRFSIQVRRKTVGIAVRTVQGFRFFASVPSFFALEGKSYPSVRAMVSDANALARARDNGPADHAETDRPIGRPPPATASPDSKPRRRRLVATDEGGEEPPEWFRWAVGLGLAAGPAMIAAAATALAG